MTDVIELSQRIKGDEILKACEEAAREEGLTAKVKDETEIEREITDEGFQSEEVYDESHLNLSYDRFGIFPAFKVGGIKKGERQSRFYILSDILTGGGFASDEIIDSYLERVYFNLQFLTGKVIEMGREEDMDEYGTGVM